MSTTTAVRPPEAWWTDNGLPTVGRVGLITPGIAPMRHQYSGGLEALMWEFTTMADSLGMPISVFTLWHTFGYGHQRLRNGRQETVFDDPVYPTDVGLEKVMGPGGRQLMVTVDLFGGPCYLKVWVEWRGNVPVYYLQADIDENIPTNRGLGHKLYGGKPQSRERLRQQLLLGFGSIAAAKAIGGITAWQLNDPHGALSALARIADLMTEDELSFDQAVRLVRAGTLTTTHTPVEDGMDWYPAALMEEQLGPWADSCGNRDEMLARLLELGKFPRKPGLNMIALAVKTSEAANGVSRRHGLESRALLQPLFPGLTIEDVPVGGICNGVDPRLWVHPLLQELYKEYLGEYWWLDAPELHAKFANIPHDVLWRVMNEITGENLTRVRELLLKQCQAVGWDESDLAWIDEALVPRTDGSYPLIIGFARRATSYKRAKIFKELEEQLAELALDEDWPVYILVAGKAHPDDLKGQAIIEQVLSVTQRQDLRCRIVYLGDYNLEIARLLVQLVHVWMGNPMPPHEACSTSGEKAVFNGALTYSVRDGWVYDHGTDDTIFTIPMAVAADDEKYAAAMFAVLRDQIVPLYYERGEDGIPHAWLEMVTRSFIHLASRVTAATMMKNYATLYYGPMLLRVEVVRREISREQLEPAA